MKLLQHLRDALVFAPCYVALDWASHVYPLGPFNITPWNPQAALAVVWILLGGRWNLPAVIVTIFAADVVVRDAPGGPAVNAMTALTLACGYAGIAELLRMLLGPAPAVRSTRQLTVFAAVTIVGTAIVGAAFIGVLRAADFLQETSLVDAWLRFWVGDGVGVLVTAPLLLAAAHADSRREFARIVRRPETIAQATLLAVTAWIVFSGLDGDPAKLFYLFFLPVIWIVVRGGTTGALIATAIVQTRSGSRDPHRRDDRRAGVRAAGLRRCADADRAVPRSDRRRTRNAPTRGSGRACAWLRPARWRAPWRTR